MSTSILGSPFARVALRTLGMAPLEREFRLTGNLDGFQRLLVVDSGQLSDLIFFLPVLAELKRSRPELELVVMVEERWSGLLRRETRLDGMIVYRPEHLRLRSTSYYRLLKEIKERAFDGVWLMGEDSDPPRDLVAYASQAALRVGAFQDDRESLINCMLRWRGKGRYKMDLAWELSQIVGIEYDPRLWRFRLRPEEIRAAEQMIHFRKPIKTQLLVGVDTSPGKCGRRIAGSNMQYLVNHLVERLRGKIMLFQVEPNAGELEAFRRSVRGEVLDMPAQGLRETLALLSRCNLFLAGNTELFHAAVAMGVPTLGLFTDADGGRWEPQERDYVRVLRGRAGENLSLKELDAVVERILHAPPA